MDRALRRRVRGDHARQRPQSGSKKLTFFRGALAFLAICGLPLLILMLLGGGPRPSQQSFPHFDSLRAEEVNLRVGPGMRYPIDWVYRRRGLPIEVLAKLDVWRKVRDREGTTGWVHQSMLSERRTAVVVGGTRALRKRASDGPVVAFLEEGVIGRLLECEPRWCRVETQTYRGWLQRNEVWGVDPTEVFD